MISPLMKIVQQAYQVFEGINFSECDGCSKCCNFSECEGRSEGCYSPWLLKEESLSLSDIGLAVNEIGSVAFIDGAVCRYAKENRCHLYEDRPLDCRMFPLDIIEEEGRYWWSIFTICPKHKEIREKLIPLISKLEAIITPEMFEQYKRQIAITKEIYPPYQLKQYEKIREFQGRNKDLTTGLK